MYRSQTSRQRAGRFTVADINSDSSASYASRSRDLIFSGEVGHQLFVFLFNALTKAGNAFATAETKPQEGRRLFLNSTGGDIYAATGILDLFEEVDDLTTVAVGACMSSALPIIAAGTPGQRYATRNTRFMAHSLSWSPGNASLSLPELRDETTELEESAKLFARAMGTHTQRGERWWKSHWSGKTRYFSAQEALELGVIDHVWEPKRGKS